MCHAFLSNPSFHDLLYQFDRDLAARTKQDACRICGVRLHVGDYPRQPRGVPGGVCRGYDRRFSFCCAECRKRHTPPSVRFLGRRVYSAVVVVVIAALHLCRRADARYLQRELEIDRRTVARWRRWWRETFPRSRFWCAARGRFATPPDPERMPCSLLERYRGSLRQRVEKLLRLILPITVGTQGM